MTIVIDKRQYAQQLLIVKNEDNGKTVRKEAFEKLKYLYDCIIKEEPKCKIDSPKIIKAKFIDKLDLPDVIWDAEYELSKVQKQELESLEAVRSMAYVWVKQNHPMLNDQSDKFGQIVNARMQIIIAYRQ